MLWWWKETSHAQWLRPTWTVRAVVHTQSSISSLLRLLQTSLQGWVPRGVTHLTVWSLSHSLTKKTQYWHDSLINLPKWNFSGVKRVAIPLLPPTSSFLDDEWRIEEHIFSLFHKRDCVWEFLMKSCKEYDFAWKAVRYKFILNMVSYNYGFDLFGVFLTELV